MHRLGKSLLSGKICRGVCNDVREVCVAHCSGDALNASTILSATQRVRSRAEQLSGHETTLDFAGFCPVSKHTLKVGIV